MRTRIGLATVLAAGAAATAVGLAASACTGSGSGGADDSHLLIAVDLPFTGPAAALSEDTYAALQLYLEQAGSRAGAFEVELVRRDYGSAEGGGWNVQACRRNAEQSASTRGQVAVIGTFHNDCTKVELPVLNQAEGGPVLMVSHANTYAGLTAPAEPGEPGVYFPTGVPDFARVVPNDYGQASVAARFAGKQLKVRRCLVLDDGSTYGRALAAAFAAEAGASGFQVVGTDTWGVSDVNFVGLFSRARPANPDCVYLAGAFGANGARLVADKVALLGDNGKVRLLAADGFAGYPDFVAAPGADGAYVTFPGLSTRAIAARSAVAEQFVTDFTDRYGHAPAGAYASYPLYAVAALQVILAAIEDSDGTSAGVRAAVLGGGGAATPSAAGASESEAGVIIPADVSILGGGLSIDPATGDASAQDVSIQRVGESGAVPVEP